MSAIPSEVEGSEVLARRFAIVCLLLRRFAILSSVLVAERRIRGHLHRGALHLQPRPQMYGTARVFAAYSTARAKQQRFSARKGTSCECERLSTRSG